MTDDPSSREAFDRDRAVDGIVARLGDILRGIADQIPSARLENLAAEPNDERLLHRLLLDPGAVAADVATFEPDGIALAYMRGSAGLRALLTQAGSLSTAGFADRLGTSVEAVEAMDERGEVFAVTVRGRRLFPDFQLGPDGLLPGVADVHSALAALSPPMRLVFMLSPCPPLNQRIPAEMLSAGHVDDVVRVARSEWTRETS